MPAPCGLDKAAAESNLLVERAVSAGDYPANDNTHKAANQPRKAVKGQKLSCLEGDAGPMELKLQLSSGI